MAGPQRVAGAPLTARGPSRKPSSQPPPSPRKRVDKAEGVEGPEARQSRKVKTEAKCFDAELCSFRELVNTDNNPTPLIEAIERLAPLVEGSDFVWPRQSEWGPSGYGGMLTLSFQLILWYHNWNNPDTKTHVQTTVSFLQRRGCAYIFQPTLPTTALKITPLLSFRPMFDMDPRSFHTFKLAWQHFLDFGSSDFRIIVGEQLEHWTQRFQAVIKKPLNAVYWLMLMVGSFYRETMVKRQILPGSEDPCDRVPVICVESFVALSAVLFCPERQLLYAGTDPTPSYLQWLQHVADQSSKRKDPQARTSPGTVFEMNEFLDLSVIIVFYGRIQQKVKESTPFSWVGNPTLIKSYIAKYAEDNHCGHQLEQAVRLYSYSCALGEKRTPGNPHEGAWYCWNGLTVCEVGVPMPCTQATFLSPFITTRPVHVFCEQHGAGVDSKEEDMKRRVPSAEKHVDGSSQQDASGALGASPGNTNRAAISRSSSESLADIMTARDSEPNTNDSSDEMSLDTSVESNRLDASDRPSHLKASERRCSCARYVRTNEHTQKGEGKRIRYGRHETDSRADMQCSLKAIADFDLMHSFAAVLACGLNLSKQIIRMHFSIDPTAFANLPAPARTTWPDAMLPWYREFHRGDLHGRTRYGILLESVLRGILGDGYLSGFHEEVLDILRISQDPNTDLESGEANGLSQSQRSETGNSPQKRTTLTNPAAFRSGMSLGGGLSNVGASRTRGGGGSSAQAGSLAAHRGTVVNLGSGRAENTKSKQQLQGVIRDIILWTDLYGTESLHTHRSHFDTFTQWCHSAQIVPLLQRCYRRLGIAGLLPWERTTGQSKMDPSYPLVLPTVPNLCYGHCYPLYRVQSYFYGGMQTIVCSCDNPNSVESSRAGLKRAPGQDRLNNHSWFSAIATASMRKSKEADLNTQLYEKLETYTLATGASHRRSSLVVDEQRGSTLHRVSQAKRLGSDSLTKSTQSLHSHRANGRGSKRRPSLVMRKKLNQAPSFHSPRHGRPQELCPGALLPEDVFFWFCQHNFALFTYPLPDLPRGILNDGSHLVHHYSDFVSRSGTPEHSRPSSPSENNSLSQAGPVPPSICLVQPTEITSHVRHRWEVEKEFSDDAGLLLGDKGWFPGALGHRFTFEAKADNVTIFSGLTEVPQAQLLFVEHRSRKYSQEERRKAEYDNDLTKNHADPYAYLWDSSGSEGEREREREQKQGIKPKGYAAFATPSGPARPRRHGLEKHTGARQPVDAAAAAPIDSASLMLPPLLHLK